MPWWLILILVACAVVALMGLLAFDSAVGSLPPEDEEKERLEKMCRELGIKWEEEK